MHPVIVVYFGAEILPVEITCIVVDVSAHFPLGLEAFIKIPHKINSVLRSVIQHNDHPAEVD